MKTKIDLHFSDLISLKIQKLICINISEFFFKIQKTDMYF